MATTSLNPGVGPTNADIATAVAAPSAATIAAAVAAPSAATIASAVAAPSASTIATAVAAAVPTTAGITSIVQANGSPYGGTWTLIATPSVSGVSSATVTGLSSYKAIRILWVASVGGSPNSVNIRLNGDSGATQYAMSFTAGRDSSTGDRRINNNGGGDRVVLTVSGASTAGDWHQGCVEIPRSNSGTFKELTGWVAYADNAYANAQFSADVKGIYRSTSAVSSINLYTGGTFSTGSQFFCQVYGAN